MTSALRVEFVSILVNAEVAPGCALDTDTRSSPGMSSVPTLTSAESTTLVTRHVRMLDSTETVSSTRTPGRSANFSVYAAELAFRVTVAVATCGVPLIVIDVTASGWPPSTAPDRVAR